MIGITSYGGYIPRYRLNRMTVAREMAWYNPVIFAVAGGEKSVANWDEDSVTMAVAAARDCLSETGNDGIDAVYFASTTMPYADRQNAGIISGALNLPEQGVNTADFGSSVRAGTTALVSAIKAVKSGLNNSVMVAASDQRSAKVATMYEMFFGDGAGAVLVGKDNVIAEFTGHYSHSCDFVDHYRGSARRFDYFWEERWIRDEGFARIIPDAINAFLEKSSMKISDFRHVVYPCYYKREHANIARKIGADPENVTDNMNDVCGFTGAAHAIMMLVSALEKSEPGDRILLACMGQGCDVLALQVTDAVKKYKKGMAISGSLERKVELQSYQKYIKFMELIESDLGIRGEANPNTSLTTLWRNRKMLLGFVGGRCTRCGTAQFPAGPVCVNPDCGAVNSMEDYEFAGRSGKILMYTGDMLSASVDPPAKYGLVGFEGGGRAFLDFTDCELDQLQVNMPIVMSFRRRYVDRTRGFTGYFWKAVPQVSV